jgi:hypothetical protein
MNQQGIHVNLLIIGTLFSASEYCKISRDISCISEMYSYTILIVFQSRKRSIKLIFFHNISDQKDPEEILHIFTIYPTGFPAIQYMHFIFWTRKVRN